MRGRWAEANEESVGDEVQDYTNIVSAALV